jgi:AbrB family transcriptional regulator (stage V sporulation protein T)
MTATNEWRSTGIVRRIDDLGRIVIPKDIRRAMRVREGDPMEIMLGKDGSVLMRRYSAVGNISDHAEMFAETLFQSTDCAVVITDTAEVISVRGIQRIPSGSAVGVSINKFLNTSSPSTTIHATEGDRAYLQLCEPGNLDLDSGWGTIPARSYHLCRIGGQHDGDQGVIVLISKDGTPINKQQEAQAEVAAAFINRALKQQLSL